MFKYVAIFFIIASIFVEKSAKAQGGYASYNYYAVGIKAGADNFNYTIDPNTQAEYSDQLNISFSGSGAYYASWLFELHGDLMFSHRNLEIKWNYPIDSIGMVPAKSLHSVGYISLPMQARINVLYFDFFKLSLGAGIMPEFRLYTNEVVTYQNNIEEKSYQNQIANNFSAVLFAFPFSANLKVFLSQHYALEASANYNLYMNKTNNYYLSEPPTALSFRLGLFYEW